jgi:YD repeat-containing protein
VHEYDPVGNVTRTIDARGIATDFVVNALNQVVRTIHAAAHGLYPSADKSLGPVDPPEPANLTDFGYIEQVYYDFNDNVVRRQVEDRTIDAGGQWISFVGG